MQNTTVDKDIQGSIEKYKHAILNDIGMKIRIIYGETTFNTIIQSIKDDILMFIAPLKDTKWLEYDIGDELQVFFIGVSELLNTRVSILSRHEESNGTVYYKAKIVAPVVNGQQREYYRLRVIAGVYYQIVGSKYGLRGTCKDISLGGLRMVTSSRLNTGDIIEAKIGILGEEVRAKAEVLGTNGRVESELGYRLKFIEIDNSNAEKLAKILEKEQLRQQGIKG